MMYPVRMKRTLTAFIVILVLGGCGAPMTCAQKSEVWHTANEVATKALEIYAVPKMGEQGARWISLTNTALDLGRKEFLARCLKKEAEEAKKKAAEEAAKPVED